MNGETSLIVESILNLINDRTEPKRNGMQGFINLNEHIKKQLNIKHWGELSIDKLHKIEKQLKEKLNKG